jgi:hypothetical protein
MKVESVEVALPDGRLLTSQFDPGTKTRPKYLAGKALASMLLGFEHGTHASGVLLLGSTPEACVP